jgi:tetratricopeptide (TPR) repeat protein
MSKKNKIKGRPKLFGQTKIREFPNLSEERWLNAALTKAHNLLENDAADEALGILEELDHKFPANSKVLDVLAVCYGELGKLEQSCQIYEQLAEITPSNKLVVVYYNLALTYPELGFPVLAYLTLQKVVPSKLAEVLGRLSLISECNSLKQVCEEQVRLNAQENNLSFAEYLKIAEPFERGRWALQKGEYPSAASYLNTVLELDPKNIPAHNNLTLIYFLQNEFEKATAQSHYVLAKLEPDNVHALANLVRLYIAQGELNKGRTLLPKLRELANRATPAHLVKIAESFAFYEDDQMVYDLLAPLLTAPEQLRQLDRPALLQTGTLGIVAEANLGKYSQALKIWERLRPPKPDLLLLRTITALENNDTGPRANERFFYFDPQLVNPVLFEQFTALVTSLAGEGDESTLFAKLEPFIKQSGEFVLEVMAYTLWLAQELPLVSTLLVLLTSGNLPGGIEVVRRFAFTRAGDDFLRIAALRALVDGGQIGEDEPVTIWLGIRQRRGTVADHFATFDRLAKQNFKETSQDFSDIASLMNEAIELGRRDKKAESMEIYRQVIAIRPDFPQAYFNLGAILANRYETAEAYQLTEQALALDPAYLPARIGLANLKIRRNQLKEAIQDFAALEKEKGGFNLGELKAFLRGKLEIANWQRDNATALGVSREWLELEPENTWLKGMVKHYEEANKFPYHKGLQKRQDEYRQKRWSEWGKVLQPDVTSAALLPYYNKAELVAILNTWGDREAKMSMTRAVLLTRLEKLNLAEKLSDIKLYLDGESSEALQTLLSLGGYAPYKKWQEKTPFTDALRLESPYYEYSLPTKLPGKLLVSGLVIIGTVNKKLVAVVPADWQNIISQSLR